MLANANGDFSSCASRQSVYRDLALSQPFRHLHARGLTYGMGFSARLLGKFERLAPRDDCTTGAEIRLRSDAAKVARLTPSDTAA
jgi:hypothetical protein